MIAQYHHRMGCLPCIHQSKLVAFLAAEDENSSLLRRCPLLTAEDKIVRLANNLQILAPVSHWHDSAKPYKDLYTQNRVLSDIYTGDAELNAALEILIQRALALPGPFFRGRRSSQVDGPLLKEIAPQLSVGEVSRIDLTSSDKSRSLPTSWSPAAVTTGNLRSCSWVS